MAFMVYTEKMHPNERFVEFEAKVASVCDISSARHGITTEEMLYDYINKFGSLDVVVFVKNEYPKCGSTGMNVFKLKAPSFRKKRNKIMFETECEYVVNKEKTNGRLACDDFGKRFVTSESAYDNFDCKKHNVVLMGVYYGGEFMFYVEICKKLSVAVRKSKKIQKQ